MSEFDSTGQDAPVVANEATDPATATAQTAVAPAEDTASPADEENKPVARTYSEEELQERIERATAKAAAKAERRAFREATERLQQHAPQQAQAATDDKPQRAQFASDEEYFDRLTDWKIDQRDKRASLAKQSEEVLGATKKVQGIYAETIKLSGMDSDDLIEVADRMGATLGNAVIESDISAKLFAHMAKNPDEIERIKALSAPRQMAELGKLELKLQAAPKTSNAPAPISPIGSKGSVQMDPEKMTQAQYEKWREGHRAR